MLFYIREVKKMEETLTKEQKTNEQQLRDKIVSEAIKRNRQHNREIFCG